MGARGDEMSVGERRLAVGRLRLGKAGIGEIAVELGVSEHTVRADLKVLRREWGVSFRRRMDSLLAEMGECFDRDERVLRGEYVAALGRAGGGKDLALAIFDRILKLNDQRLRAFGIDGRGGRQQTLVQADKVYMVNHYEQEGRLDGNGAVGSAQSGRLESGGSGVASDGEAG